MSSSNHWNTIVTLLHKQLKGELSKKEQGVLDAWLAENNNNPILLQEILDQQALTNDLMEYESFHWIDGVEKLAANGVPIMSDGVVRRPIHWRFRYMMAAAAVLLLVITGYLWISSHHPKKDESKPVIVKKQNDLPPGKYRARLTLADGSTIVLDSVNTDSLTRQGMATVANKNGKLVYNAAGTNGKHAAPAINTLTTAKAETYQLLLSDGSKVWLNSQSSIRYPVAFSDDVRKVEITGEAYFEVAPSIAVLPNGKRTKRPFIVSANGMEVEVLGTHFNINSYSDEAAIKTTLLEGKVRIHAAATNAQAVLNPGEQAIIRHGQDDKISVDKEIDVDAEVAWRFGFFNFNNVDLKTMMRQLERWYDVEVEYQGEVPEIKFLGKLPRELSLAQLLTVLQRQNAHFKLVGKRIIVTP
jgi:transmembrane sensor